MAYLTIYEKVFAKNKDAGKKQAKEERGNDIDDEVCFDLDFCPEVEFDKETGKLNIFGELGIKKDTMAFIDTSLKLDLDIVVDIIDHYMKKLGKLKTVIESTK